MQTIEVSNQIVQELVNEDEKFRIDSTSDIDGDEVNVTLIGSAGTTIIVDVPKTVLADIVLEAAFNKEATPTPKKRTTKKVVKKTTTTKTTKKGVSKRTASKISKSATFEPAAGEITSTTSVTGKVTRLGRQATAIFKKFQKIQIVQGSRRNSQEKEALTHVKSLLHASKFDEVNDIIEDEQKISKIRKEAHA